MKCRLTVALAGAALLASLLANQHARAQTPPNLVGTWKLVSLTVLKSGSPTEILGEHPEGQLVFGDDGHYTLVAVRSNLPKLASGDRLSASADESERILQGSVAHFGTYVVKPASHTIEFHIRKGTFPNWDGEIQARPFDIDGDRLTYVTPGSFGYGASTAVWQRDKSK
ncbi:lipocalin-like domain-containing protein [Paraburkholderia bengalensis]|uniref:Lipocalin-like domain-containing protein n=1 Tax=Paraburkholderia bengalensis TaxID=2747562 RepID=A0ABU8IU92_9BURK